MIRPSALLSYLLVAAALVIGWRLRGEQYLTAESGLGYALGITGGLMMLVLFLYPLRKKARFMRRFGPIKYWFKTHIVLGVLGPLLVLFHANFGFGSINSRVALISTLLVAGSGFIGRYFYAKIHHGLFGRKATLQELQQQAEALQHHHAALDLVPELHQRLSAIEDFVLHPPDGVIPNMGRPFAVALRTRTAGIALSYFARRELKRKVASSEISTRDRKRLHRQMRRHITARLQKVRKVAEFTFYERLFSLWHILHYPLFVILVVAAFVHVFAVHMY